MTTGLTNRTQPRDRRCVRNQFTSYFNDQLPDAEELNRADVEPDDDISADNDLYCLRASDEILSVMHRSVSIVVGGDAEGNIR